MELINYLIEALNIDMIIVILVLAAGAFQKKYLVDLNLSAAVKTLIVSFFFTTIYIILLYVSGALRKEQFTIYFISYAVATSFYEIVWKEILQPLLKKKAA
jgi:hypothetical protein